MTTMKGPLAAAIVAAMMCLPAAAAADTEAVGYVKTVTGDAFVVTTGQVTKAAPGTPVMQGSTLRTGANSTLGLTFRDNTIMSFGPQTEMVVDQYLYAPAKGELGLSTRLLKGSMNYVSGMLSKLKPDAVSVQTPTSVIGIRGTHFVVKVEEEK
jgi:hypothetical protein